MKWNDSYIIGIPIIDTQHKQLFYIFGELNNALRQGARTSAIAQTLKRLNQYVSRHFSLEERYMAESDYNGLIQQVDEHRAFSQKLRQIIANFEESGLTPEIAQRLREELSQWLLKHVSGRDMAFGRYYNSRSNQPTTHYDNTHSNE